MFLKNKKNIFKIRRSKVTDYAALRAFSISTYPVRFCLERNENRIDLGTVQSISMKGQKESNPSSGWLFRDPACILIDVYKRR